MGAVPEHRASAGGARPPGAHPRSTGRGGRPGAGRNLAVVPTRSLVGFQTREVQNPRFGLGPEVRAFADGLGRILLGNQRAEDENAGVRADVARGRCAAVAQALRERQHAGTWLAHWTRMAPELSEEERELVQHFTELPHEDRGRILALVRSLNLCRMVEVYRGSWPAASFTSPTLFPLAPLRCTVRPGPGSGHLLVLTGCRGHGDLEVILRRR